MGPLLFGCRGLGEQHRAVGAFALHVDSDPEPGTLREWDQLVHVSPGTDVTQLSAWARVRGHAGYLPVYMFVRRDGQLVGGAQLLYREVIRVGRIGYVSYGPLTAPGNQSELASELLAEALSHLGSRCFHALFIQPPEDGGHLRAELLRFGFRNSRTVVALIGSLRVNVQVGEAELQARAGRRLRPSEKRWDKYRVAVREGGESDLPILARLLGCSAGLHGFQSFGLDYLQALYRELKPSGQVLLLIGEADGRPLAADLLTINANMLRGRLMGFDRSGRAPQTAVPAAVTWAGINWARDHGLRWYDMGGLPGSALSDMLDRNMRYNPNWPSTVLAKLGWGGQPFRYPPPVELIRPGVLRRAYDFCQESPAGQRLMSRAATLLRG